MATDRYSFLTVRGLRLLQKKKINNIPTESRVLWKSYRYNGWLKKKSKTYKNIKFNIAYSTTAVNSNNIMLSHDFFRWGR